MAKRDRPPRGAEWREFYRDNALKLRPELRKKAVEFLYLGIDSESQTEIHRLALDDPEWWAPQHFGWGMAIRNALRKGGFGEKELAVDNLDDYYVGLVEMALGITEQE